MQNEEEAVEAAKEKGYPLAMKIISPQITHKSDAGNIKLSLRNSDELRTTYHELIENVPKKVPDPS